MKKERIEYLDILRAIGILYMIFGHITLYPKYDHYIHAFHMPLFFFITGYFFTKNEKLPWKDFIKKTSKKLLIPYFILGFMFSIIDYIFLKGNLPNNLLIMVTTNNEGFPIAGAFWYFTCLFFGMLIFYILRKVLKKDYLLITSSLLIMLLGVYFKKIINVELWLSLIPSFVSVGFITLGYYTKKYDLLEKYRINNPLILITIFLLNGFIIFKTGYVNMRTNNYPNFIILLINFIGTMFFYINFSRKIENISFLNFLTEKLNFIGKYSILFLELNQFIILIIKKVLVVIGIAKTTSVLYSITIFIMTIIIIYFLTKKIIKSKIRIIFGL